MNRDTIKRALIFSLIGVFFCCIPISSFAASSDMVDLSSYLVNFNEEITWEYANVECPTRERVEINMVNLALTRPIPVNSYNALYSIDMPRSTIQFANVTDLDVLVMGRVYITGLIQLDTPSGYETIYSDTQSISVTNNNQIGQVPRWTYGGDPLTFYFDLSGYDGSEITRFQIQFIYYNQRTETTRYTFYVRHQITEFYAAPYDISDLGNQITGAINDQTSTIVDSIQQDPGDLDFPDMEDIAGSYIDQIDTEQIGEAAGSLKSSYNALSAQSGNTLTAMGEILDWLFLSCDEPLIYLVSWGGLVIGLTGIMIALFQRK